MVRMESFAFARGATLFAEEKRFQGYLPTVTSGTDPITGRFRHFVYWRE